MNDFSKAHGGFQLLTVLSIGLLVSACDSNETSARADEPQEVSAWIELHVRMGEQFEHDQGHWTAAYTQAGMWRLRSNAGAAGFSATLGSDGDQRNLTGDGYHRCHDGSQWRRFDFFPPVEAETVTLAVSAEGERLVLWASVPQVWMERRESPADCRPEPPYRADFRLHDAELEAAGAIVDRFGNHRLADFAWEDIAAAAEGLTAPLTFDMHREAAGVEFQVRGSLGSARQ